MQFIIATEKSGNYRLQVFNRGFQIGTHVSASRRYVRRVIRDYTTRMDRLDHYAHGHPVHVIWA